MKLFACALGLTCFLVGPAHAQFSLPESMPQMERGTMACNKGGTVCLVNREDFEIVVRIAKQAEAMKELARRLGEDLEGKNAYVERLKARLEVCHPPAKLEVLPQGTKKS